jgi:hydroxymethylbilane synthase
VLRLGTRGSQLALTQSRWVAARLERTANVRVEIEVIQTHGDRVLDRPLPEIGGKGLFTAALDQALLNGSVDLAVHSLKDLPTEAVDGLAVTCIPEREDPRDVLVGPLGKSISLEDMDAGSVVGTSSLRRKALLAAFRPDLSAQDVRGTLDTRLRKLDAGGYDALLLAAAGLKRLGLASRASDWLERNSWLPAPGQGALAVVSRVDDPSTAADLSPLHHPPTASAVLAERTLLHRLGGGCHLPVGALAQSFGVGMRLRALVVSVDGARLIRAEGTGHGDDPEALGESIATVLLGRGAAEVLDEVNARALSPSKE